MTAEQLPGVPHQPQQPQPVHDPQLTLAGVSRDGKRLLLVSGSGLEFVLPIDSRLTAALRGETSRLGQLEIPMESTLRPRDIQARIRAGETPEAVALAAQTSVEKIMPYAAPVLAEREHITQRAQRSSLRRASSASRTLGDAVSAHLRGLHADPDAVAWDAWRREDGRWTLTAEFDVADTGAGARRGTGTFTFDAPGNFVVLEDDHAQWLVGDAPVAAAGSAVQSAPAAPDARRGLSAVRPEADREPTIDLSDAAAAVRELDYDQPVEAFLDTSPAGDAEQEQALVEESSDAQALDDEPPAAEEPPARRSIRKKGGRASVPTWDEIMFGGGKQE